MSATFVSSTTSNTAGAPASSLTITKPTGISVGDTLLASISVDAIPTITAPSGWTLIKTTTQGTALTIALYGKIVTASEPSNYQWTFGSSEQAAGVIVDYTGSTGFLPDIQGTMSGTSTATLVGQSINNSYTGKRVYFWGTRNTTGSSTITPASGWTGRADTCTTASDFIEAEAMEVNSAVGFPVGGIGTFNNSASQTALSYVGIGIFLEDAHVTTPLQLDSFWGSGISSASSLSLPLTTNYPNELVVVAALSETGTNTVSSVTNTAGLTFQKLNAYGTSQQGGDIEIWYALAPTPIADSQLANNVTVNFSASINGEVLIWGIAGVRTSGSNGSGAFGATNSANASASSIPTVSLTTTANNSWVFAIQNSSNTSANNSAGAGQTTLKGHTTSTTSASLVLMQNAATPSSGTSVSSSTAGAATDWNMYAFEVLAGGLHELSLLGVGN